MTSKCVVCSKETSNIFGGEMIPACTECYEFGALQDYLDGRYKDESLIPKEGPPFGSRNAAKYPDNLKPVTIRLLPAQLDKLKAIAAAQSTTYNELIRRWIDSLETPE